MAKERERDEEEDEEEERQGAAIFLFIPHVAQPIAAFALLYVRISILYIHQSTTTTTEERVLSTSGGHWGSPMSKLEP